VGVADSQPVRGAGESPCALCGVAGGPQRLTADGRTSVHIVCAMYAPEVRERDTRARRCGASVRAVVCVF
jgi:hypothetical protein